MTPVQSGGVSGRNAFSKPRGSTLWVAEGDSITNSGSSWISYADRVAAQNALFHFTNLSVGGSTVADMVTRASTVDAKISSVAGTTANVLSIMIGTNDIYFYNGTAANTLTALQAYIDARIAAGWNKIVLGTMLPRGSLPDTQRAIYNAGIKAMYGTSRCAQVADFGGDPIIGVFGTPNDTSLYLDLTHPTQSSQDGIMTLIARIAICSATLP